MYESAPAFSNGEQEHGDDVEGMNELLADLGDLQLPEETSQRPPSEGVQPLPDSALGNQQSKECVDELDGLEPADGPDAVSLPYDDPDFQRELVAAILRHEPLLAVASEWLKPKSFTNRGHQTLVRIGFDYYRQHRAVPTNTVLQAELKRQLANDKGLAYYMGELAATVGAYGPDNVPLDYYTDKVLRFAEADAIRQTVMKSLSDCQSGRVHPEELGDALANNLRSIRSKCGRSTDVLRSWDEFEQSAKAHQPQWVVPNWLQLGKFHVMTGLPFGGKSSVVADMVAANCNGSTWAGMKLTPVPVIMCDLENGDFILHKRIIRALSATGGEGRARDLLWPVDPGRISGPVGAQELEAFVDSYRRRTGSNQPGLIIGDTLRSLRAEDSDFDENNNSKLSKVLKPYRQFAHQSGWAFLLLHHNNKGDGYSGGTAIPSNADIMWSWHGNKETFVGRLQMIGSTDDHQLPLEFKFDLEQKRNLFVGTTAEVREKKAKEKKNEDLGRWLMLLQNSDGMTASDLDKAGLEAGLLTEASDSEARERLVRRKMADCVKAGYADPTSGGKKGQPARWSLTEEGSLLAAKAMVLTTG